MYKKKLLKLLAKIESWDEFKKALCQYFYSGKSIDVTHKIFETFAKYYFLSEPSQKGNYKNAWLYDEIPKDIINKFNLKKIKDNFSLLLESKNGQFTLVKCKFVEIEERILDSSEVFSVDNGGALKEFNRIIFTNTLAGPYSGNGNLKYITVEQLQKLNKVSFDEIRTQLKADPEAIEKSLGKSIAVFKYSLRAIKLVWSTSSRLTVVFAFMTLVAGLLPAATAYLGKLIIDSVVYAAKTGTTASQNTALLFLAMEAGIIILLEGSRRGLNICQSLLRALLGQKVNVLILEKALKLDLSHFENSEFYDKMTRARREASSRPLSLVNRTFNLIQSILSLAAYGALLFSFSAWAVIVLVITAIPSFISETRFAGQAFRLFNWRSPETREQLYLETLIAREDHAKEVKLYQLGPMMLDRYRNIFERLYGEDRDLTVRRGFWGFALSLLSTGAFYAVYAWIVIETIRGKITLGEMTMYLMVFRQGQSTLSGALSSVGGMYEDNLYLSSLYEFLEQEIPDTQSGLTSGYKHSDGIRFENVTFSYPGSTKAALKNINLHIKPGEKMAIVGGNGSGKTTLIKLLTRLYNPDSGRILLDGLDLREWDMEVLHKRIGVIFQNFVHYQFTVGENVGVGDVQHLEDEKRWETASEKGMALPFIKDMPAGFKTQLGSWFKGGQELSLGQWQKIALSRAFMRSNADILVLDEPTSAMDAEAEVMIFEHFKNLAKDQMVLLISHRFSTVRMADKIVVIENGNLVELGTHQELLKAEGRYARLFTIQAAGYQ
jgi:ABC-type multidrug transport system fused ATPase/permease subunit